MHTCLFLCYTAGIPHNNYCMSEEKLISYIKESLEKGAPKEKLTEKLVEAGWEEEKIKDAFAQIEEDEPNEEAEEVPISTNVAESVSADGRTAVSSSSKKSLTISLILAGVLVLGVVAYGFSTFFTSSGSDLESRIWSAVSEVESVAYEGGITSSANLPSAPASTSTDAGVLSLGFSAATTFSEESPRAWSDFTLSLNGMALEVETRSIDTDLYFKVAMQEDESSFVSQIISPFSDRWIYLSLEDLENSPLWSMSNMPDQEMADYEELKAKYEQKMEEAKRILRNASILEFGEQVGTETVAGVEATQYPLTIDKEALKQAASELFDLYAEDMYAEYNVTEAEKEEIRTQATEIIDEIQIENGYLWVGDDSLPRKVSADISSQSQSGTTSVEVVFSDYNVPVEVEAPEESVSFEELFSEMFQAQGIPGTPAQEEMDTGTSVPVPQSE